MLRLGYRELQFLNIWHVTSSYFEEIGCVTKNNCQCVLFGLLVEVNITKLPHLDSQR